MLFSLLSATFVAATTTSAPAPDAQPQRGPWGSDALACEMIGLGDGRSVYVNNLWDGGVVPYRFDGAVIQANRDHTRQVMDEIESWCDVRFVTYTGSEPNWITVRNSPAGQGNSASVGQRAGGVVNIRLWESSGMILHELMHTLGFLHEQSRADRDDYLNLFDCAYANGNYNISPSSPVVGPYDFDSITHYTAGWGCDEGEPAYEIRAPYYDQYASTVGTWHYNYRGPSNGDIWSLYTLYGGDPIPGPFVYAAPANAGPVTGGEPIAVSWEPSGLADSYRLQIDRSTLFRFPVRTMETTETSAVVEGLAPGRYYWRCAAINERGENFPRPKPEDVWSFVVTCGVADTAEPYGVMNFFDVSAYLDAFSAADPSADLNNDGAHNFFDVSAFLTAFAAGCP